MKSAERGTTVQVPSTRSSRSHAARYRASLSVRSRLESDSVLVVLKVASRIARREELFSHTEKVTRLFS